MVDDLDGSASADVTAVRFSLDGRDYEIDLNGGNAQRLRDELAEFVAAARLVRPDRGRGKPLLAASSRSAMSLERAHAIREWAQGSGHVIAGRGRIPATVIEAYERAQQAAAISESPAGQGATASERPAVAADIRNPAFSG